MKTTKNILLYLLSGFLLLCIMLTTSGCTSTNETATKPEGCSYYRVIIHKESPEWDLYFWDVDCDNFCDGATLELKSTSAGRLRSIPMTAAQAWKFWTEYLHEQKRMGA